MKFQRNEIFENEVLSSMMEEITEDRTNQFPGVTDLIFCLTKAYWKRTLGEPEESRTTKLYFTTGLAMERALLKKWKEGVVLEGEVEGIFFHSDGEDTRLWKDEVIELKTTRMGAQKGKAENYRALVQSDYPQHWFKQIAAYLYAKGKTNKAKLVVVHIIKPELLAYDLEFSDIDLISNWMELQSRRTELLRHLHPESDKNIPPKPFKYNMEWECNNCTFKALCDAKAAGVF